VALEIVTPAEDPQTVLLGKFEGQDPADLRVESLHRYDPRAELVVDDIVALELCRAVDQRQTGLAAERADRQIPIRTHVEFLAVRLEPAAGRLEQHASRVVAVVPATDAKHAVQSLAEIPVAHARVAPDGGVVRRNDPQIGEEERLIENHVRKELYRSDRKN